MSQEKSSSSQNHPTFPDHLSSIQSKISYYQDKKNLQNDSVSQTFPFPSSLRILSSLSYSLFPKGFPYELKENIYSKAQNTAQNFQNFTFEFLCSLVEKEPPGMKIAFDDE